MNAKQSGTHWLGELHHLTEVDLNKLTPWWPNDTKYRILRHHGFQKFNLLT